MTPLIGQWSYVIAAALFGAVTLSQLRRDSRSAGGRAFIAALLITALSALIAAFIPASPNAADLANGDVALSQLRDMAWLGFLYLLWRRGGQEGRSLTVALLYGVIAALFLVLGFAPGLEGNQTPQGVLMVNALLHIMADVGALVLIHNLYTAGSVADRDTLRLPLLAIAALWIYDLNLYTISYLSRSWPAELLQLQGVVLSLTAPVFGLSVSQNRTVSLRLSRSVAFQSVSLFVIGGYLVAMVAVTAALELIGGETGRLAQISFVFAASLMALLLGPSARFRAWFRVKVSKHLFQHRYDYRSEWLRFTETLGRPGERAATLGDRVVQAIADIVESPAGLLLTPDANGALLVQARWNWSLSEPPAIGAQARLGDYLTKTGRVVELDVLRAENSNEADDAEASQIPEWILSEPHIWIIVPLVHFGRLAGVIVLTRPFVSRTLDWEDFDLLRVVGRQVASYLAEAQVQEELSDARRFDEFNRRFAFIMHDIKNLVSQLSLVTRNAERHADNPAFRADMIETLKSSTARMNALLAKLSQHNKSKPEDPRLMLLAPVLHRVQSAKSVQHPVMLSGDTELCAVADPARLEQALSHLVQNAIEASEPSDPVTIKLVQSANSIDIHVIDTGCGMSAAFVDAQLYKPFTSTKEGGFGVGTYEARSDINEMGGHLSVTSRVGSGTTFVIELPRCASGTVTLPSDRALAA